MIFSCDDYEQVNKFNENMNQVIQERQLNLRQDDRVVFSYLRKEIPQRNQQSQSLQFEQIFRKQTTQAQVVNQLIFLRNQLKQNDIEQKNEDSNSDTLSLSIISEEQQFNIIDLQQWQQVLNQYGNLFKEYRDNLLIETDKSLDYFFKCNKYVQQIYNNNNKVYLGLLYKTKEWIVVKEQELQNQSLIGTAQQFINQDFIYQLYPTQFFNLKIPVYIEINQNQYEKLKFISLSEQGLIDLYQYSQQRLIPDLELSLIFQQLFQQIQLLHKHNIAHRDIKPQNVIYVQNKGWLLCDFEYSLRYISVNGIYDIKGTYSFLLPYLQLNSKIQGVQLKQNLLQNDLYALAITLIVIKYQIKNQEQIDYYLKNPKDHIVQVLLKIVQLQDLHKYIFRYDMRFIRPQLQLKQQDQQVQNYQNQQIIEFLLIVKRLNNTNQIPYEQKTKYLNEIDDILKQHNNYFNYFHIVCYQEIPQYVDQLKYIIKYIELRQRKYWIKIFYKLQLRNNQNETINSLKFMYNIGFRDLFLQTAQQYINIQYDFSIHMMIIYQLHFLKSHEEYKKQLNILLKNRDFYQMNQMEQSLFTEYIISGWYEHLNQQEMDYLNSIGLQFKYTNFMEFLLKHYYDDKFLEKITSYFEQIMKEKAMSFNQRFTIIKELVNDVMVVKDLQTSLRLLEELKQQLKFQCPTVEFQQLIKMIIQFYQLLGLNYNKKLKKKMNYVILFNSESVIQQDLLKFQKLSTQLYFNSCQKSFKNKIIDKIYLKIRSLSKLQNKLYLLNIMKELILILQDAFYQKILFKFFQILVSASKQQQLQDVLEYDYQKDFQNLIILCYKQTKNQKRVNKSLAKDKQYVILNQRNSVKYKEFEILNYSFLLNQYLHR